MGRGLKGGASHFCSLLENEASLKNAYEFNDGYFGEKGKGRSFTRNIICDDPKVTAKAFYDNAAYGGLEKKIQENKGVYTKLADGSVLSYRESSTSDGSPAVEINIRTSKYSGDIKQQKIHFVKGR